MKVILFTFIIFFSLFSVAQDSKRLECPEWNGVESGISWNVRNVALACRSICKVNSDCTSAKDPCGRAIIFNKKYSVEIEQFLKANSGYRCESYLEVKADYKLECKSNRCEPTFTSCEVEKKRYQEFMSSAVSTSCENDNECTFLLVAGQGCAQRVAVNTTGNAKQNQLNMDYLRDAYVTACKENQTKECDNSEKAFCVSKECVMLPEKPRFKNFVNFEGPKYVPNFQSNTTPLKMPSGAQSKCLVDQDCVELFGICSQYAVSLNKKFVDSFMKALDKVGQTIACPVAGKISLPKSRCFKNFCSFVN